jgi:hypothetical protein
MATQASLSRWERSLFRTDASTAFAQATKRNYPTFSRNRAKSTLASRKACFPKIMLHHSKTGLHSVQLTRSNDSPQVSPLGPSKIHSPCLCSCHLLTLPVPDRQIPPKKKLFNNLSPQFSFLKIEFGSFSGSPFLFHSDLFLSYDSYFFDQLYS